MDEPGSAYPVLFTLHEIVSGNGFLASVTVKGRGSMVQEDDGAWWLYGVQPGGMSQTGNTPQEAHLKFAADFRDVLFDLASDASDFRNFEKLVTNFLCQVNDPEELRWTEAVAAIRAGRVPQDQFLSSLPRLRAESKCGVIVQRLDRTAHHKAKDNKSNTLALPLAA